MCVAPVVHAVAKRYSHMDMLDESEIIEELACCLCKSRDNREPMRRFACGVMVAFSEAYLMQESDYLNQILETPHRDSPVELSNVKCKKN
ncbi:unnamed protein product [Victoria cruziana]